MKRLLRSALGWLVDDYRINWIYAAQRPVSASLRAGDCIVALDETLCVKLAGSTTDKVRNSLSYARAGLEGLALVRQGEPLCIAHFARFDQYDRASTWPLDKGDIALMDIATQESARGQGLAPQVIAAASRHFATGGQRRLIAFIWWSNTPSIRAFGKAGWRRIGLSVEWRMAGRWRAVRLPIYSR
jgi:GNAT superfamily N-acetyltransferase